MFLFCLDEFCDGYPHNFTPTPGYWIECSRQSARAGRRRNHGIQEEGSQDNSNSASDDEDDDEEEEGDGQAGREDNENGTGVQTDSFDGAGCSQLNQRHPNGVTSVFTSTDTVGAGPSDRSGRKVQLVHQHIQVPVDIQNSLPPKKTEKKKKRTLPSKPIAFVLFFFLFCLCHDWFDFDYYLLLTQTIHLTKERKKQMNVAGQFDEFAGDPRTASASQNGHWGAIRQGGNVWIDFGWTGNLRALLLRHGALELFLQRWRSRPGRTQPQAGDNQRTRSIQVRLRLSLLCCLLDGHFV